MSGLREALTLAGSLARRIRREPPENTYIQRAADRMVERGGATRNRGEENDEAFLERLRASAEIDPQLENVRPRDLARLTGLVWRSPADAGLGARVVERVRILQRQRFDRPLIEAYLREFPTESVGFKRLSKAAEAAAARHESPWPWAERARRFRLFEPTRALPHFGRAILDHGPGILAEAGLLGGLEHGRFAQEALRHACNAAASDPNAEDATSKLVVVANGVAIVPGAALVRGLLKPWSTRRPSPELQRRILASLVRRYGDPRLERTRWDGLRLEIAQSYGDDVEAAGIIDRVRFWLVEAAVHQFLDVVDYDADPAQWRYRKAFWLSYLDKGYIEDAWVAFGPDAAIRARAMTEEVAGTPRMFADLHGGYQPSQSVLLMRIGDLTVGDWSHTGRCRFWSKGSKASAVFKTKNGQWKSSYNATDLRRLDRLDTELPHPGAATFAWQYNFNELIGQITEYAAYFEYDSLYPREHFSKWNPGKHQR